MKHKALIFILILIVAYGCATKRTTTHIAQNKKETRALGIRIVDNVSLNKVFAETLSDSFRLSEEESKIDKEKTMRFVNHLIAEVFIELIEKERRTVGLGYFSWQTVKEYWTKVPELKAYRNKFEISSEKLSDFIDKKDDRPQYDSLNKPILHSRNSRYNLYSRLAEKYPNEYGPLRKKKMKI